MKKNILILLALTFSFFASAQQQSLLQNKIKVYEDTATLTLVIRNDEKVSKKFFIELDGKKSKKPVLVAAKKSKRVTFKVKDLESKKVKKFKICTTPELTETETFITRICSTAQVYRY